MAEPLSLNLRMFTVKLVGVRKFRNFTVLKLLQCLTKKAIKSDYTFAKYVLLKALLHW